MEDRRKRIPPFNDGGCGVPDDDGVEHNDHSSWRVEGHRPSSLDDKDGRAGEAMGDDGDGTM